MIVLNTITNWLFNKNWKVSMVAFIILLFVSYGQLPFNSTVNDTLIYIGRFFIIFLVCMFICWFFTWLIVREKTKQYNKYINKIAIENIKSEIDTLYRDEYNLIVNLLKNGNEPYEHYDIRLSKLEWFNISNEVKVVHNGNLKATTIGRVTYTLKTEVYECLLSILNKTGSISHNRKDI